MERSHGKKCRKDKGHDLWSYVDPGIFVRWVQVSLTKKKLLQRLYLVLSLFYRSQMVNCIEIYHFSRFQRGSNIFQVGPNFFQGGGSNCLFPIETHITCDFPGGSGPPVPPLDPHLVVQAWTSCRVQANTHALSVVQE